MHFQLLVPSDLLLISGCLPVVQASAQADGATRRVGPFTVTPDTARKLLASIIKRKETSRAEDYLRRVTGAQQVRLVDMDIQYITPAGSDRPLLSPVYVPAYVFSWMHGGVKVRTFVSGVNPRQVTGTRVLNDQAVALVTAGVSSTLLLVTGAGLGAALLWGGLAIPFLVGGLAARFWPMLRQWWTNVTGQYHSWREQRTATATAGDDRTGKVAVGAGTACRASCLCYSCV